MRSILLLMLAVALSGCTTVFSTRTSAEKESGYTYIPVDPFSVEQVPGAGCEVAERGAKDATANTSQASTEYGPLLKALPDNAVRMLIERFNASGTVTYGPGKLGAKDETYRVTVDYINADTRNFRVWISKSMQRWDDGKLVPVSLIAPPDLDKYVPETEFFQITRDPADKGEDGSGFVEYNIPIYIGIGLRVTATVDVVAASANISGIGVIGAEAEAERLKGSLIVQTLGVNGKSIAAALPIQSELNRTTAQNAIVAVGSIKALLYADETTVSPRVVGIYLPFPGGKPLVNALISELSKFPIQWARPCDARKKST